VLLVDGETARRLGHGQPVAVPAALLDGPPPAGGLAQALDERGNLVGIVRWLDAGELSCYLWKAEKWLAA
jgi:hypothetical protein